MLYLSIFTIIYIHDFGMENEPLNFLNTITIAQ